MEHFKHFLYGAKFTIVSDHKPLTWLRNMKEPSSRLERWLIRIRNFKSFEVEYREGAKNDNADGLSRWLLEEDVEPDIEEEELIINAISLRSSKLSRCWTKTLKLYSDG